MEASILSYFDYRWRKNKIFPLTTEDDLLLYDQLPIEIKVKLCSDFLFRNFLSAYSRYFHFLYPESSFDGQASIKLKEFQDS